MKKLFTGLIFVLLALFIAIPVMALDVGASAPAAEVLDVSIDISLAANVAEVDRTSIATLARTILSPDASASVTDASASTTYATSEERSGHRRTRYVLQCYR